MDRQKILAIAGSLRAASSNAALVRSMVELAPEGVIVEVYKGMGDLPLFSPDIDGEAPPSTVQAFRKAIEQAQAVVICTPEYAYGMPGSLKNALDWLVSSGSLYQKTVAALSASPSPLGGDKALAWLRQTLRALDARVPEEASFPIPFLKKKLVEGKLEDTLTEEKLRQMFLSLV